MPRRQKTAPQASGFAVDPDSLPELTEQQHKFVIGILEGKTASDAYRIAYPRSPDWEPTSLWCEASKLRHNTKVQQWLRAAVAAGQDRAVRTIDRHISELADIQRMSLESGNMGAAAQCAIHIGKVSQLYRDSVEVTHKMGDLDLIGSISNGDPELAAALRRKLLGEDAQ